MAEASVGNALGQGPYRSRRERLCGGDVLEHKAAQIGTFATKLHSHCQEAVRRHGNLRGNVDWVLVGCCVCFS